MPSGLDKVHRMNLPASVRDLPQQPVLWNEELSTISTRDTEQIFVTAAIHNAQLSVTNSENEYSVATCSAQSLPVVAHQNVWVFKSSLIRAHDSSWIIVQSSQILLSSPSVTFTLPFIVSSSMRSHCLPCFACNT